MLKKMEKAGPEILEKPKRDINNNRVTKTYTKSGQIIIQAGNQFPSFDIRERPKRSKSAKCISHSQTVGKNYQPPISQRQFELRENHISTLTTDLAGMHAMLRTSKIVDHNNSSVAQDLLLKINKVTKKLRKENMRPCIKLSSKERIILPDLSYDPEGTFPPFNARPYVKKPYVVKSKSLSSKSLSQKSGKK